jgi:hypothetical protein
VPAIEAAIRTKGGVVKRNERFGDDVPVDITAYVGTELRLAAAVIHARDELALIGSGERFAELVKRRRSDNHHLRGLVVMLGAVLERHVSALDAAFPETDMVSGEEPGGVERLPDIIARALAPVAQPVVASTRESQEALEATRIEAVGRAIGQDIRSQEVLGDDNRSEVVRQTLAPDPQELARQETTARQRVFEGITKDLIAEIRAQFFSALLHKPLSIAFLVLSLLTAIGIGIIQDSLYSYQYRVVTPILWLLASVFFLTGLGYAAKLYLDLPDFRNYRAQEMEALFEDGAPISFMLQRNKDMANMLSAFGPRGARLKLIEGSKQ